LIKEFKKQIVQLHENGKPRAEIIKKYELTPSSLDRWVSQYTQSGSYQEKDNRSKFQPPICARKPGMLFKVFQLRCARREIMLN
jgi:transposase-like protein